MLINGVRTGSNPASATPRKNRATTSCWKCFTKAMDTVKSQIETMNGVVIFTHSYYSPNEHEKGD
jgi:hypothetical protein